jgi:hypothetical protein
MSHLAGCAEQTCNAKVLSIAARNDFHPAVA